MKKIVFMKPNSKKGPLVELVSGVMVVYVREPAVDGKANEAMIRLLSEYYGVSKTNVKILRGISSRHKVVEIS